MPITYAKTDEQIEEEAFLCRYALSRGTRSLLGPRPLARGTAQSASQPLPEGAQARLGSDRRGSDGRRLRGRRARFGGGGAARDPTESAVDASRAGLARTAHRSGRDEADALRGLPLRHGRGRLRAAGEWRAVQAELSGQPAFCVFTDKTLMAIAESVPEDQHDGTIPGFVGMRSVTSARRPGHLRRPGRRGA
ncbi:HRDC domain-containing protein [Streptomyces sp. DHE17-7]|uniref:HRDC domain-containing protein n=1 Tax=Streptomyces sp. DHE17-7 TaxID=2759949 RepID=UPI003FA6B487